MMTGTTHSWVSCFRCLGFLVVLVLPGFSTAGADDDVDFFEKRIRPIFVERCE